MLQRVYIDNFRCFVNFELSLAQQQLILGLNGTGKSTLLDALRHLKQLIAGDALPDVLFPYRSRTRWQSSPQQTFELHVMLEDSSYRFRLELSRAEGNKRPVSNANPSFAKSVHYSSSFKAKFISSTMNRSPRLPTRSTRFDPLWRQFSRSRTTRS